MPTVDHQQVMLVDHDGLEIKQDCIQTATILNDRQTHDASITHFDRKKEKD